MTSRELLGAFFDAENRREWGRYVEFLHPDVEWEVSGRVVRGRDAYLRAITAAYAGADARFRQHQVISSADDSIVAALLVDNQGNRSLDVFEFEDGLIRREWEYLLGAGEDWAGDALELC